LPRASALQPVSTVADLKSDACAGLSQVNSSQGCSTNGNGVTNIVSAIIDILSIVVGIAAVVMIIVSGLKFITSGGDSQKVGSAKTSLIYALIGLAIVALSQALVHFVLNQSAHAVSGSTFFLKHIVDLNKL
jgi:uncharacterized membrane protein YuzA (DUF378 family)